MRSPSAFLQPLNPNLSLAFLGAGRITKALIRGLLDSGRVTPQQIIVSSKSGNSAEALAKEYGVMAAPDNLSAITTASVVFLCTKPTQALAVLLEGQHLLANKLIISVVTGIRSEDLFVASGRHAHIIRSMPNTAIRLRKGVTSLSPHSSATPEDNTLATQLFSSVGMVYHVQEEQQDAITAISGSGPAFFLLFIESLIQGGIEAGLDPTLAQALSAHAAAAAAALILETNNSPESLRAEITSPQGTTEAGISALQKAGLPQAVKAAVHAATERAKQLATYQRL
ncbi:MAG TPA: pyrroline-5-carboxylate reductase [Chthoniobacterales bacterium]|nr:pyrroline-5-carboxylate reductase [Chthoniobacterales bacterium]